VFAPFTVDADCGQVMRRFYLEQVRGKKVLLVDDVRNTGQTFARCAALLRDGGGEVVATAEIYDRLESVIDLGVPNYALAEYKAPDNYPATECPLCRSGVPVAAF
jgi:orotate phosphoribosyltransferase